MSRVGSKEKVRQFLLANIGRVIESHEIQEAADGAVQYSRRLRELREQEGWKILTERLGKKIQLVGDDLLVTNVKRPGEIDPATGRKVRLHIGHIKDKSLGGKDELPNLRALCSTCNQGAKNITTEKATAIWLLSQIRRAGQDEQRAVFEWLRKKFSK